MDISPRWSSLTKAVVTLTVLVVIGALVVRFQLAVAPLIMAVILAYLLNPLVDAITRSGRISRGIAVLLIYAALILLGAILLGASGLLIQQQASGILSGALALINNIPGWIASFSDHPVVIGPWTIDVTQANTSLLQTVVIPTARDWIGQATSTVAGAASGVASTIGWGFFIFVVSFYILSDLADLRKTFLRPVPPDYRRDAERLLTELGPIWDAFLRGQLTLSLIMAVAVGTVMSLLGLRYSLVLALLAAVMEFIPMIGPYATVLTAILIAMFQAGNWLGIPQPAYTIIVAAAALLLQQIEANFLSPRVMGSHLRLPPAILIIGALVGATLAGIPGLLLAGPILASIRLFGRYAYAKMFDLPPWPDLEEQPPHSGSDAPILCRPARPDDKPAVLALTARIWEGHDYIPEVWEGWLTDPVGTLAVAESGKTVVGIGKLSRLAEGEWWMEGVRVHPEYQGRRIGSRIFEYLFAEWERKGGGVIRLATSSERVQIHHLCGRMGFRRAAVLELLAASTTTGAAGFMPIRDAEAGEAAELAERIAAAWRTPNLVNLGWRWGRLTPAQASEFIRKEQAWWWKGHDAALMMYTHTREGKPAAEVAAVLAPTDELAALLEQARALAGVLGAERIFWPAPDTPFLTEAAQRASFQLEWDARLWIFEHPASIPATAPLREATSPGNGLEKTSGGPFLPPAS